MDGNQVAGQISPALNDEPAGDDLLGYEPYAKTLAEIVAHPDLGTPFTVGIFGPWGAGKSSFMVQIRKQLIQRGQPFVFFQPWVFDQRQEVWKALILSVVQYLQSIAPKTWADEAGHKLEALSLGVAQLTVNKLLTVSGLTGDVEKLEERISRSSSEATTYVNTFRRGFEENKEAVLRAVLAQAASERAEAAKHIKDHRRLFVFIDDLDRCTPEGCVMVLEAVKLFFGTEGCVFILGIDAEIVQRGIELKYRDNPKLRGRDYLEKLIQLPFTLPPIAERVYAGYVEKVAAPFGFSPTSVKLIGKASEGNPRRVKRLINCLLLIRGAARAIGERNRSDLNEDKLALLLILQAQFPAVYSWFARDPEIYPNLEPDRWHRIKTDLVPVLEAIDGPNAGIAAERFRQFWQSAHSVHGVPSFGDVAELVAHLRVSGLVESGDPTKVARLAELLDKQFPEPSKEAPAQQPSTAPIESPAQLKAEVAALQADWKALWSTSPGLTTLVFPSRRIGDVFGLVGHRDKLLVELHSRFSNTDLSQEELALRQIGLNQAAREFSKIGRLCSFAAFVVLVALGGLFANRYPTLGELSTEETEDMADDVRAATAGYSLGVQDKLKVDAAVAVIDELPLPSEPEARARIMSANQDVSNLGSKVDFEDPKDVLAELKAALGFDVEALLARPENAQTLSAELINEVLDRVPSRQNKPSAALHDTRASMLDAISRMTALLVAKNEHAVLLGEAQRLQALHKKVADAGRELIGEPREKFVADLESLSRGAKRYYAKWIPNGEGVPDLLALNKKDSDALEKATTAFKDERAKSEKRRRASFAKQRMLIWWSFPLVMPILLLLCSFQWSSAANRVRQRS